jgi:hypothetical protein
VRVTEVKRLSFFQIAMLFIATANADIPRKLKDVTERSLTRDTHLQDKLSAPNHWGYYFCQLS